MTDYAIRHAFVDDDAFDAFSPVAYAYFAADADVYAIIICCFSFLRHYAI